MKKLTSKQVKSLYKTIGVALRKLVMDKMDYGSSSDVPTSIPKLLEINTIISRIMR